MSDDFEPEETGAKGPAPDADGVSYSAAATGRKTVFVKHPVLPGVKKAIVNRGFRILDARFAPADASVIDGQTGKALGGKSSKRATKEA